MMLGGVILQTPSKNVERADTERFHPRLLQEVPYAGSVILHTHY